MRKILVPFVLIAVFLVSTPVQASIGNAVWNAVKSAGSDRKVEPVQIEIEVAGNNARGYAFYVEEMKSMCFIVWGSSGSPVMECKTTKEMGVEEVVEKTKP